VLGWGDIGWLPSGRRRPSLRIGIPWFLAFLAWLAVARAGVDHPALRRPGVAAWGTWALMGSVALPAIVAVASRLLLVPFSAGALWRTALATLVATAIGLPVLHLDYPAFAFLGGFAVAAVAAGAYALCTSKGMEAWRDVNLP
jgi:hypothetical protein